MRVCSEWCLLDGASEGACSGNTGGICKAGWQRLQGPLRWGSIEGLLQLPLLQLVQQQLGIGVPVLLPHRIVGLHDKSTLGKQGIALRLQTYSHSVIAFLL